MTSERRWKTLLWAGLALVASACEADREAWVCETDQASLTPTEDTVLPPLELPDRTLLLLDYSGSMYGGYGDVGIEGCGACQAGLNSKGQSARQGQPFHFSRAPFQTLLAELLAGGRPTGPDSGLEILLFNKSLWVAEADGIQPVDSDTHLDFDRALGQAETKTIASWVGQIPEDPYAATRPFDGEAPNQTLAASALLRAIELLEGPGVVWLVTDNIVDAPSGVVGQSDADNNKAFYDLLRDDPRLRLILAYPLHTEQECDWMCGTSFFAYGIYVDPDTPLPGAHVRSLSGTDADDGGPTEGGLLWNRSLKSLATRYSGKASQQDGTDLAGVPLRLKPIDNEVVSLDFTPQEGGAVVCDSRAQFGVAVVCKTELVLRNVLRHQRVQKTELVLSSRDFLPHRNGSGEPVDWASPVCGGTLQVLGWKSTEGRQGDQSVPIEIGPLDPLQEARVEVLFAMDPVEVAYDQPRQWLEIAMTEALQLDGAVVAELATVETSLVIDTDGLEDVYGAAALPKIFRTRVESKVVVARGTRAWIRNDGQLLAMLLLGGGSVLVALVVLVIARFQRAHYTLIIDGARKERLSLPRISSTTVDLPGGAKVRVKRGWGRVAQLKPARGGRLVRRGGQQLLTRPGSDEEIGLELKRGWKK